MPLIALINGPNLNLLGSREPHIYGTVTWEETRGRLAVKARELGLELEFFQSNSEGALVDYIQEVAGRARGLIINPGALTHYGYSLRDAIASTQLPVIEVHITNIHGREDWRSTSVIAPVVTGIITGLGTLGYELALQAMATLAGESS